jgi:hypothetical protein
MAERSRHEKKSKLEKLAGYKCVREGEGACGKCVSAVVDASSVVIWTMEWMTGPVNRATPIHSLTTLSLAAQNRKGETGKGQSKPKAPPPPDVVLSISAYRPVGRPHKKTASCHPSSALWTPSLRQTLSKDHANASHLKITDMICLRHRQCVTVMSLTVRTIMNHKENKREFVCATARIWHNCTFCAPIFPCCCH